MLVNQPIIYPLDNELRDLAQSHGKVAEVLKANHGQFTTAALYEPAIALVKQNAEFMALTAERMTIAELDPIELHVIQP